MGRCRLLLAVLISTAFCCVQGETLRGTLVDEANHPIAGAKLSAYVPKGDHVEMVKGETAADGAFQIENIPKVPTSSAPFVAIVELPNGHMAMLRVDGNAIATKVIDRSVNVTLTYVDSTGAPIVGCPINIGGLFSNRGASQSAISFPAIPRSRPAVTTDSNGVATFSGLPGGVSLFLQHRSKKYRFSVRSIQLPEQGVLTQKIVGLRTALIRGRVTQGGKPLAKVQVTAQTLVMEGNMNTSESAQAITDDSGNYVIEDAYPGNVHVQPSFVPRPGDASSALPWIGPSQGPLVLKDGQEVGDVNFVVAEAPVLHGKVLTLNGGKPVANVMVFVSAESGATTAYLSTGLDGTYQLEVAPGSYYIAVNQYGQRRLPQQVYARIEVTEKLAPSVELRIPDSVVMPPLRDLQGVVLDAANRPVSGATVKTVGGEHQADTDAAGHFSFSGDLEPGTELIAVKGDDMSAHAITVATNAKVELRLSAKSASLEGSVTNTDGKPLLGIELSLGSQSKSGHGQFLTAKTDAKGKWRISGLFPDEQSFYVWAKSDDYAEDTQQSIFLKSGEHRVLQTFKLRPRDGEIEGKVLNPDGSPAIGINVVVSSMGRTDPVVTDASGHFRLTRVPRGENVISATRNNVMSNAHTFRTGQKGVVIRLQPDTPRPIVASVSQSRTGLKAPKLQLAKWVFGPPIAPEALRGRYVVLNFWGTWCMPCVRSLGTFQGFADKYASKRIVFIGIHGPEKNLAKVKAAAAKQKVRFRIAVDQGTDVMHGKTYGAFGGSEDYVLIAPDGKILLETGNEKEMEQAIKEIPSSY